MELLSQMGLGFSNPQQNPESVVNLAMTGNVPLMYEMLNTTILEDIMVNQLDDMNSQIKPVDHFLANVNNAQMVDDIIEARKELIFANMVTSGMTIASLDTSITLSPQM